MSKHPGVFVVTVAVAATTGVAGCGSEAQSASQEPTWLEAPGTAAIPMVARQLRGLDVAMLEIDHRYTELYHAGMSHNWAYAKYQLEKLKLVMDLALERRPQRAQSAQTFYYPALTALSQAIVAEDSSSFADRFGAMRDACNACHQAEKVPTFRVGLPAAQRSTIHPD